MRLPKKVNLARSQIHLLFLYASCTTYATWYRRGALLALVGVAA